MGSDFSNQFLHSRQPSESRLTAQICQPTTEEVDGGKNLKVIHIEYLVELCHMVMHCTFEVPVG